MLCITAETADGIAIARLLGGCPAAGCAVFEIRTSGDRIVAIELVGNSDRIREMNLGISEEGC